MDLTELTNKLQAALADKATSDARVDSLEKELAELKENLAKTEARADSADAALAQEKTAREAAEGAVDGQVRARIALETTAAPILGEDVQLSGMSDREIQVAVVAKVDGTDVPADKDDTYVAGRFDSAVERAKANAKSGGKARPAEPRNDEVTKTAAQKRQDMIDYETNRWKRTKD